MKKKLFLLITCFFLFSSLTIFLTYQNIQFSKIIKNKGEKVKKLLKKLENQKEKRNADQKKKNKDNRKEIDDLPWLLNWKGAILSLVVCSVITVLVGKRKCFNDCFKGNALMAQIVLLIILFFGLSPFLLAIAKYKDKSYKERYCLLWRSYWKPFVCTALSVLFAIVLGAESAALFPDNLGKSDSKKFDKELNEMVNDEMVIDKNNNYTSYISKSDSLKKLNRNREYIERNDLGKSVGENDNLKKFREYAEYNDSKKFNEKTDETIIFENLGW